MRYAKLLAWHDKASPVVQCFDVPLGMLIPVSVVGELVEAEGDSVKPGGTYTTPVGNVGSGQVMAVCVNCVNPDPSGKGKNRFSYMFDSAGARRVRIADLNARSWPELVMKMAVNGLLYSTDEDVPPPPEALLLLQRAEAEASSLRAEVSSLKETAAKKDLRIAELEEALETASRAPERPKGWRAAFERMFGSEDGMSHDPAPSAAV